jgi:hypothetical protein
MEAHADSEQYPLIPQGESVTVIDPALLEEKIADWPQMCALLTDIGSQHLQEGIDYYTLIMHGISRSPRSPKPTRKSCCASSISRHAFQRGGDLGDARSASRGLLLCLCPLYQARRVCWRRTRCARSRKDKDVHKAIKMA